MKKLTPMQKLEKITDEWIDGKRYKKLTPFEMDALLAMYETIKNERGPFVTFLSAVAEVAEGIGFKIQLDEDGVNYEIYL